MKLFTFLTVVFISCFTVSIFAQNNIDKNILRIANNAIANKDYKHAEKQLKKVSSAGKETTEYLLMSANCNEKLTAYNTSATDYTTLYNKTKDVAFQQKAALMTVKYQTKLRDESLVRNCKICDGTNIIYENSTCNTCNGDRYLKVTCRRCNGIGNVRCITCGGSGKIVRVIAYGAGGQKVTEESVCNNCNGTGNPLCNTCHGNQQQTITCSTCNGMGQIKTAVKCPAHN